MKIASATQFKISLPWGQRPFSIVSSVLNVKALVGAISVVVKTGCGTDGALHSTKLDTRRCHHATNPGCSEIHKQWTMASSRH